MKYLIYRTSTQRDAELQPHPLARLEKVRVYKLYDPTMKQREGWKEEFFSKCTEIVEVDGGAFRGIMFCDKWTIEIDDMVSFIHDLGEEIVLSMADLPDIKLQIEIYDDYRE